MLIPLKIHVPDGVDRGVGFPVVDVLPGGSVGRFSDGEGIRFPGIFREVPGLSQESSLQSQGYHQPGFGDVRDGSDIRVEILSPLAVGDAVAPGVYSHELVGSVRKGSVGPPGVIVIIRCVIHERGAGVGSIQAQTGTERLDLREVRGQFNA